MLPKFFQFNRDKNTPRWATLLLAALIVVTLPFILLFLAYHTTKEFILKLGLRLGLYSPEKFATSRYAPSFALEKKQYARLRSLKAGHRIIVNGIACIIEDRFAHFTDYTPRKKIIHLDMGNNMSLEVTKDSVHLTVCEEKQLGPILTSSCKNVGIVSLEIPE